jgi:hypothetical protein
LKYDFNFIRLTRGPSVHTAPLLSLIKGDVAQNTTGTAPNAGVFDINGKIKALLIEMIVSFFVYLYSQHQDHNLLQECETIVAVMKKSLEVLDPKGK